MILWKRTDVEGHEAARLDGTTLRGMTVLKDAALTYRVDCDDAWRTVSATVIGWCGDRTIDITLKSSGGRWTMNGTHVAEVDGCIDVDLNFSPSTNLLPIRRLDLAIGESADVKAAWLRFPTFSLEPLQQSYTRTGETTYRYKSASFTAEITVNEA
ncbi:MAG TPA: putative glycolipid-binding domain-containing protein, partial [Thermoanaerobaculia bacterium]|nr:putative glycolipid-binding domain-containing protein [Thermoanaerobaculia bacterium]